MRDVYNYGPLDVTGVIAEPQLPQLPDAVLQREDLRADDATGGDIEWQNAVIYEKTADKLLKKTADVWKISQETDLVDIVIRARGEEPEPRAYVLLLIKDITTDSTFKLKFTEILDRVMVGFDEPLAYRHHHDWAAELESLLERKGRRPGQMIGRSPWLQSVHVETSAAPGELVDVTLVAAGPNSMTGALLAQAAA